ncbi:Oxysterol-binding protein-related protein 3 [Larimichthys crocea]|uniref:Uncharacterized protein n=1 Tax=Larimichthys crocea TaxID=215358 RepID=A0ACD3QVH8_LARCR|nr:Oxysterol-binding protein-related protein 3 [Larimichthys crocea]
MLYQCKPQPVVHKTEQWCRLGRRTEVSDICAFVFPTRKAVAIMQHKACGCRAEEWSWYSSRSLHWPVCSEMGSEERSSAMSQKISSMSRSNSSSSSKHDSRQDSWEIVEGLRGGFSNVLEPQKQEGYMLKRKKVAHEGLA